MLDQWSALCATVPCSVHACRFSSMVGQSEAVPFPRHLWNTFSSQPSLLSMHSAGAGNDLGVSARLASNRQRRLCLYPFDKKTSMQSIGKTMGLVLLVGTIHICGFTECFSCGIPYLVSCRKARSYLTQSMRLLLNIINASLTTVG